jgi:hypothetical protein
VAHGGGGVGARDGAGGNRVDGNQIRAWWW